MVCTECGARLMDTDQFCPKCGTKVKREKRCPDCGAALREGTKFCHKCGRLVEGSDSGQQASEETLDIPIDAIEQNILSETEAEIKAGRGDRSKPRRTSSQEPSERRASSRETSSGKAVEGRSPSRGTSSGKAAGSSSSREVSSKGTAARSSVSRNTSSGGSTERSASGQGSSAKGMSSKSVSGRGSSNGKRSPEPPVRKKPSNPEPPRRKRAEYRDDDWDDEDWEDDDWDDEDEDEGVDVITVMTAVVGCVLLAVIAILGYNLYKQYAPRNYGQEIEEEAEGDAVEAEDEPEQEQEVESGQQIPADSGDKTYMITVISNVNVRDKPSTSGSSILMVAQAGDVYACYGSTEDGEWYEIRLEDGTPAYVFHEYISVNEDE